MFTRKSFVCSYLLIAILAFATFPLFGAEPHPLSEELLGKGLPNRLGEIWRASSPARKETAENVLAIGDAKLLAEY